MLFGDLHRKTKERNERRISSCAIARGRGDGRTAGGIGADRRTAAGIAVLRFRSGRERFCLPVLDVEEVVEWPLITRLPLSPAYVLGIFNLRGAIVPLIDIALTEGRRTGLLPKHVVVASLHGEGNRDEIRVGIAADEVVGTYSVVDAEDLLEQAPENVPHCIGMLRHEDRLALVIDLRRLLEVYPGPSI